MKELQELFGENVKKFRQKKKISQEQLASLAGLNRTYIQSIEKGKRNVSIVVAEKIAISLGVNFNKLVDRNGN